MTSKLELLKMAGASGMSWSHSTARATGDTLTREDVLNSLSGLKGEAMLWASLCYINHGDSKALATLTSRLAKLLSRRYPDIKPKVLVGLVQISFHEHLAGGQEGEKLSGNAKAKALGIARTSFHRNRKTYDEIINAIFHVTKSWDDQIATHLKKR